MHSVQVKKHDTDSRNQDLTVFMYLLLLLPVSTLHSYQGNVGCDHFQMFFGCRTGVGNGSASCLTIYITGAGGKPNRIVLAKHAQELT